MLVSIVASNGILLRPTRGEEEMVMHVWCSTEECEAVDLERATLVEKVSLLEKALKQLEEENK